MLSSVRVGNPLGLIRFSLEIYEKRGLIWSLSKRDFKSRYIGSSLGLFWAFAQPLMMMTILWFVFTFGLRASPNQGGYPFVAWFFPAMIAWNFFSEAVLTSSNVFHEYSYLVKKIKFKVAILPLVKIVSAAGLHAIFLGILAGVLIANGILPSFLWLQVFYYFFASLVLLVAISLLSASLNIFLKDVSQVVGILIQFGFWVTPVIWDPHVVPEAYQKLIKLNPVYYIVEGYRGTFLYKTYFWDAGLVLTAYFWLFSLTLLLAGVLVFKRLRPHFADVL